LGIDCPCLRHDMERAAVMAAWVQSLRRLNAERAAARRAS